MNPPHKESWEQFFTTHGKSLYFKHRLMEVDEGWASVIEFIKEREAAAHKAGREAVCDEIEANCDWIKEDVPDGNYGYFKLYPKEMEAARNLEI